MQNIILNIFKTITRLKTKKTRLNIFKKDPDKLLKEATSKKKAGDIESAINLLKGAYKESEEAQRLIQSMFF